MKEPIGNLWQRFSFPPQFPTGARDRVAFWIGTGFGSGLLRPAPGTWGSVVGMGYLYLWWHLPGAASKIVVAFAVVWIGIWAAAHCERLFGKKDPSSVVIDEIVGVPAAFYPLLYFHDTRWWVWLVAFVLYRVMDILKLWPARQMESLGGGPGVVMDDVTSSIQTGLLLLAFELATL